MQENGSFASFQREECLGGERGKKLEKELNYILLYRVGREFVGIVERICGER